MPMYEHQEANECVSVRQSTVSTFRHSTLLLSWTEGLCTFAEVPRKKYYFPYKKKQKLGVHFLFVVLAPLPQQLRKTRYNKNNLF